MTTPTQPAMSEIERFELVCWLIERSDSLRESTANRAAIVVSADALLLAGTTFLLDKTLLAIGQYGTVGQVFLIVNIGITTILLILSLIFATTGIVNLRKTKRSTPASVPPYPYFNAFEVGTLNFDSSKDNFSSAAHNQMTDYALHYLWFIQNLYCDRYQALKRAVLLLLVATISFALSILVVLVLSF
jgi:hypothetical protein